LWRAAASGGDAMVLADAMVEWGDGGIGEVATHKGLTTCTA